MAILPVPSARYTANTRIYNLPQTLARQYTGAKATFTRENWGGEGQEIVTVICEKSLDGETWEEIGRASFPGGTLINPRTGEERTFSSATWFWTNTSGESVAFDGDIRFIVINTITLRTAITLEMFEP